MVGHRLASWTLIHELDTTGMSRVYLARNEAGRLAALKVPLREDHYERFANEVRLSRRIRSAFVAQVVDARPDPPEPYVAFEYIQGPTLSDQVRLAGPKPDLRLLAIGLAEGLRQIHHAGIVHRDLKPGNVIVTAERPIIIDFGIARDPDDDRLTQAGMVVGTRAWLSPEQERGEPVGPSSDIYNWARLIEWSADRGVADASAVSADGMSVDLCAVVADALVDDPAARPTAEQIVTRLTGHDGATLADDFAHNWVMAPVSVPAMEDRSSPEPQNTSGPVVVGASSPPSGPSASDIATPRSDVGDVAKPSPLRRRGPARPLALGMLASVLAAVAVGVFLIAPWITSDRASSREAAGDSSGAELGLGGDTDADTDQAATPIPSVDDPEHPTSTSNADSDSGETPVREAVPGTEADVDSPDGAEPQLPRYTPSPQPIVAAHVRLSDSGHGCEGGLCGCPASGSYSRIDIEHGAAHPYASDLVTVSMTWSGNAPIEGQLVTFRPDYARGYHWTRIGYRQEAFLDVERQYWVSADGSIEENLRYVTDRVHLDGRSYYGWKKDNSDGWEGKKRPRGQSHATSHVLCYRQPATSEWKTTIPITVVEPEQCRYSTHGQVYENCYEDTFEWRSGRAIVSDVDWYEWFSACRFRCTRE